MNCNCICHTLGRVSESLCKHCDCPKAKSQSVFSLAKDLGWIR